MLKHWDYEDKVCELKVKVRDNDYNTIDVLLINS